MGLRRLLTRQPAEDPLERLAELGREAGSELPKPASSRPWPFAELATESEAPPLSPVSVEKKSARILSQQQKREPPDARNFAVWKRQQSPGIEGLFDRKF